MLHKKRLFDFYWIFIDVFYKDVNIISGFFKGKVGKVVTITDKYYHIQIFNGGDSSIVLFKKEDFNKVFFLKENNGSK